MYTISWAYLTRPRLPRAAAVGLASVAALSALGACGDDSSAADGERDNAPGSATRLVTLNGEVCTDLDQKVDEVTDGPYDHAEVYSGYICSFASTDGQLEISVLQTDYALSSETSQPQDYGEWSAGREMENPDLVVEPTDAPEWTFAARRIFAGSGRASNVYYLLNVGEVTLTCEVYAPAGGGGDLAATTAAARSICDSVKSVLTS